MNKNMEWINRQIRLGRILIAAGLIAIIIGIVLPGIVSGLQFNPRIITGIGIVVLGIGISYQVRFGPVVRDAQAARRLVSEERDERMQLIRGRAGYRAFWTAEALIYAGLMWVSFAESGSLPPVSTDTLWYFLAVAVIVPFIVFAVGMKLDQDRL